MVLTTKIISNRALSFIGAKQIVTFGEDTVNGRIVSAFYSESLEEILCEYPWTFAQKRAELTDDDTEPVFTDDLMTVTYSKPSGMLKLNFVNNRSARVKLEGNKILSDTSELYALYTYLNEDPTTYFPLFTSAFATLLAANMAYAITNSSTLAERLHKLYEDIKLPKAMSADSMQGSVQQPQQDEWLNSRILGGGGIAGQTGFDVWYPC